MRLYRLFGSLVLLIIIAGLMICSPSNEVKEESYCINESSSFETKLLKNIDAEEETFSIDARNYDIVKVAYKELDNVGGEKYWSYFGFPSHVPWCACFASWCADQCGLIDENIIPRFTSVGYGYNWFRNKEQWIWGSETPEPGMIIFFDYTDMDLNDIRDGIADHVGIVKNVEDGYVYCIEGNYKDTCKENKYEIGSVNILGYGVPNY